MSLPFRIATFNLQNFFQVSTEEGQRVSGAKTAVALEIQLAKLALALELSMGLPDILIVQEVGSQALLQQLADRVNKSADRTYKAVSPPTSDKRGIQVGFLFEAGRVGLNRVYQMRGQNVAQAFGDESANPCREPLIGEFQVNGRKLTLIGNHFKSNFTGDVTDRARETLLGINERQRLAQAEVVRTFVNQVLSTNGDAWLIAGGDFNDCPRRALLEGRTSSTMVLAGRGTEIKLTNLLLTFGSPHAYTFLGRQGPEILDHLLVSPSLRSQVTAVFVPHINVPYPAQLATDPTIPFRSSDHDPLIAEFSL